MSLSQDVEVLRTIPLFAKIEPTKLKLLAFTSERLEFMAGERAVPPGRLRRRRLHHPGRRSPTSWSTPPSGAVKVASLHKNDIIGEIAILCDVPRTATVVAATSSRRCASPRTASSTWSPSSRRSGSR